MDRGELDGTFGIMLLCRWPGRVRMVALACVLGLVYYLIFRSSLGSEWGISSDPNARVLDESLRAVMNSTLGFQKILVINMPSRTDRRDAVSLSAAVSNFEVEFIDGVKGDSIPEEAFPPGESSESIKLSKGIKGSWRSHMNALQRVVHDNLTSALIFEDDLDWDIRLRPQLQAFALASRFMTSESYAVSQYPIEEIPNPETPDVSIHNDSSQHPIAPNLHSLALSTVLPTIRNSKAPISPYGDPSSWDLLWLGHCGVGFPRFSPALSSPAKHNIVLADTHDPTVPQPRYLKAHPFGPLDALASSHENHTRVYHRASGGALCTIAYAVSQRGARRLLHEFGIKKWGRIFDVEMGDWCAGTDIPPPVTSSGLPDAEERWREMEREKKGERVCLTVQPPLFAHHHPAGGESNIGGLGGGYARDVGTKYIRLSVRMNLEALVRGEGRQAMVDQWPD